MFVLLQEAHQYVDHFGNHAPDSDKHILFYLVVQAVLYIFCFRNKDILDTVIEENEVKIGRVRRGGGRKREICKIIFLTVE